MTFTEYITETTDLLTSMQDKNPLFYMFVSAKLKNGSDATALENDFSLKSLFSQSEKLSRKLGNEKIKFLANAFPPAIILIMFEEHKYTKIHDVLKKILKDMQKHLMSLCVEFSEAYKVEQLFDEFINSKELEDYFSTLRE